MRKDTPVNTQLPEWKKEVAEKVKAYGERKKRLTTPPYAIKQKNNDSQSNTPPVKQTLPFSQEREISSPERGAKMIPDSGKQSVYPPETLDQPNVEVWPQDIHGVVEPEVQKVEESEGASPSTGPYVFRRILAGLIDHTILLLVAGLIWLGSSLVMGKPIELIISSSWKGCLLLFLLLHFVYYLYFFRASRQTPGMLFVSLELRDPVIRVIPLDKLIVRWFAFILLNIFNLLPPVLGKKSLLHDMISGTEMRSFK